MLNKFLYKEGGDQCRGSQLVNMCRINRIVISQSVPAKDIRNYHRRESMETVRVRGHGNLWWQSNILQTQQ